MRRVADECRHQPPGYGFFVQGHRLATEIHRGQGCSQARIEIRLDNTAEGKITDDFMAQEVNLVAERLVELTQ